MDYKEKYEAAKSLYQTANSDQRYVLEKLFPELAGSEDEKIRKMIQSVIENDEQHSFEERRIMSDWLEKQGEQKPVAKKPVFEIGETITDGASIFTIVAIKDEHYIAADGDKVCFYVAHKYYTPFK